MSRWEPNAAERLVMAALDLFTEQGYASTTAAQITSRAGLTRTTLFRHFPDKRDVLFVGHDALCGHLAGGVASAPAGAAPLEAVGAALDAAACVFTPERREFAAARWSAIAANAELRERDAFKRDGFVTALRDALEKRGVPDPAAILAARIGELALSRAEASWSDPGNRQDFRGLARQSLEELRAASAALS